MPGPFNFESQKVSARKMVLAANKQAAYGTAVAVANMLRRQKFDGSASPDQTPTWYSDKDMVGKDTEFATQGQITGWDTKFGFKADADDWLAGFALALVMGKETVTGAAAPYTHAFSIDESTTQAAATSIYLEDTNDVKRTLIDMAATDVTITIPQRGPISIETNFVGTGRWTNGALADVPALTNYAYLLGNNCDLQIGPTGALVSKIGRHLSSTIKIETGTTSHLAPGLGLYGAFPRLGLRKVSIQTTFAATDTDDVETLLENGTNSEVKWIIGSTPSALTIDCPNVRLKTNKLGTQNNMVVWQFEADETTMFNTGAGIMTATVINAVASYLAGA